MSGFIYHTLIFAFIGSIFFGLAGCVTDGSYESGRDFPATHSHGLNATGDVLSGGFGG